MWVFAAAVERNKNKSGLINQNYVSFDVLSLIVRKFVFYCNSLYT